MDVPEESPLMDDLEISSEEPGEAEEQPSVRRSLNRGRWGAGGGVLALVVITYVAAQEYGNGSSAVSAPVVNAIGRSDAGGQTQIGDHNSLTNIAGDQKIVNNKAISSKDVGDAMKRLAWAIKKPRRMVEMCAGLMWLKKIGYDTMLQDMPVYGQQTAFQLCKAEKNDYACSKLCKMGFVAKSSQQQCAHAAATVKKRLEDPMDADDWYNLGVDGGGKVKGRTYSAKECYIEALGIDERYSEAWNNLGVYGHGGSVAGRSYSRKECYHKALGIDDRLAEAWSNFGREGGGTVSGRSYAEKECYLRALSIDDRLAEAWVCLGAVGGGTLGDRFYSEKECYHKALGLDDRLAATWIDLGLVGGGAVGGHSYSKKECYIKALQIDSGYEEAWFNLGVAGGGTVGHRFYSEKACYIKVLEIDNGYEDAWYWLGKAGGGAVGHRFYSKKACYIKALEIDNKDSYNWNRLADEGGGTVHGVHYSSAEARAKADHFS